MNVFDVKSMRLMPLLCLAMACDTEGEMMEPNDVGVLTEDDREQTAGEAAISGHEEEEFDKEVSESLSAPTQPAEGGLCGGYHKGAHCTVKCDGSWYDLGLNVAYGSCQDEGMSWCWNAYNQHKGYQGACWSF